MIKVSVLIPVFNTAKTLGACLRSVLSQTRKDIEIVCVDDGSDRETKEELAKWLKRDGRIRAVTFEKNRGTLVARKRLIEEAQGQYLMFLDSDDTLEKTPAKRLPARSKKRARTSCSSVHLSIIGATWRNGGEETSNGSRPNTGGI